MSITTVNIHSLLPPSSSPRWACKWHGTIESEDVFISLYDVRCGRCGKTVISANGDVTMAIRNDAYLCEQEVFTRWRAGTEREKKSTAPRGL